MYIIFTALQCWVFFCFLKSFELSVVWVYYVSIFRWNSLQLSKFTRWKPGHLHFKRAVRGHGRNTLGIGTVSREEFWKQSRLLDIVSCGHTEISFWSITKAHYLNKHIPRRLSNFNWNPGLVFLTNLLLCTHFSDSSLLISLNIFSTVHYRLVMKMETWELFYHKRRWHIW